MFHYFSGPASWAEHVEGARGKHQSPVDIQPAEAKFDSELKGNPLKIEYKPGNVQKLVNNGHTVVVKYNSEGSSKYNIILISL